ncbi:MAG: transcriptional regulator [Bacteroidia bacterium]|nr:transcriptional regulator [Bacteroidia bacterium]
MAMAQKTVSISKDISVFYVEADSFPEGIETARERFKKLIGQNSGRELYGISRPENNKIIYRVGAEEEFNGEGKKYNCHSLGLKKGRYASLIIENYMENLGEIKKAFDLILQRPDLDPLGYCVEKYLDEKEMICMVRLKD